MTNRYFFIYLKLKKSPVVFAFGVCSAGNQHHKIFVLVGNWMEQNKANTLYICTYPNLHSFITS